MQGLELDGGCSKSSIQRRVSVASVVFLVYFPNILKFSVT
jgi:hypothetical protein